MGIRVLEEVTLDDEGRSRTTGDRVGLDVLRRLLHRSRREVQSNSVLTGSKGGLMGKAGGRRQEAGLTRPRFARNKTS